MLFLFFHFLFTKFKPLIGKKLPVLVNGNYGKFKFLKKNKCYPKVFSKEVKTSIVLSNNVRK